MIPACRRIRAAILNASHASGQGHIPTSFSIVECLYALYRVMRHDPARPAWPERDLFVLSKGHGALGLYAVLAELGYFPAQDLERFGAHDSPLGCHPDRRKVPGVEASTGSLGHGVGLAVGMALGIRVAGQDRRVYTLIGDGESNEGSVWEAVMVAANLGLRNLTLIYDDNQSQGRCLPLPEPAGRFRAFGCDVLEVDGHDVGALEKALAAPAAAPRVVVAHTRKGYGCRTLVENVYEWHRRSPKADEVRALIEELHA